MPAPVGFPPPMPTPSQPPPDVQPQQPNIIRPMRTLPVRPLGGGATSSIGPSGNAAGEGQPMSPDDAVLAIEAQRAKALSDNDPMAKILPTTDHTQDVINEFGATQ